MPHAAETCVSLPAWLLYARTLTSGVREEACMTTLLCYERCSGIEAPVEDVVKGPNGRDHAGAQWAS